QPAASDRRRRRHYRCRLSRLCCRHDRHRRPLRACQRTIVMIIAVDGPAASGKGTLASGLARHYQLPYLDTGLLYRAVGLAVTGQDEQPGFEAAAIAAARALDASHLNDIEALTSADAGVMASKVAVIGPVRQ